MLDMLETHIIAKHQESFASYEGSEMHPPVMIWLNILLYLQ